jgi:putative integral membrane protein (TIGR02587 family)
MIGSAGRKVAGRGDELATARRRAMLAAMSVQTLPGTTAKRRRSPDRWGFHREGRDLLVAVTGGAILGMPLLYTMEMWLHGMLLGPSHQLALLLGILCVNLLFSIVSGFRHEYGVASALLESVTAVGIGMLFSTAILWLVGEIAPGDAWSAITGKVLLETTAVSIGVSVADAHVRGKRRDGSEDGDDGAGKGEGERRSKQQPRPERSQLESQQIRQDVQDIIVTLTGAVVYSINIGPTEEVMLIAGRLTPLQLAAIVLASVGLCYIILYASGIKEHPVHIHSLVQSPPAETVITYAASLTVALGLLAVLGEPEAVGSLYNLVASTVVLGLPTCVGGAAGRLAL